MSEPLYRHRGAEFSLGEPAPLVAGGQGRSAEEVRDSGFAVGVCVLGIVAILSFIAGLAAAGIAR